MIEDSVKEVSNSSILDSQDTVVAQPSDAPVKNLESTGKDYEALLKSQQEHIDKLIKQQELNQKLIEQLSHTTLQSQKESPIPYGMDVEEAMYEKKFAEMLKDTDPVGNWRYGEEIKTSKSINQQRQWAIEFLKERGLSNKEIAFNLALATKKAVEHQMKLTPPQYFGPDFN